MTEHSFSQGLRAALPVVLGYLGIGLAAGVVERAAGLLAVAAALAVAVALVVATLTRSLLGTVAAGVALNWLLL